MHERHARLLALAIGATVVATALAFAARDRPEVTAPAPAAASPATPAAERGKQLFVELGCVGCHSFRGVGGPRGALDDAESRADPEELARWIVAAPEVADRLPRRAREAKQRYRALPSADLEALVELLRTTR